MLNKKLKEIAEIALIGGIPEIVKDAKPGRARNLSLAVEKATQRMLGRMPDIDIDEKQMIYETMSEFGRVTGWEGKERQLTTYLSFVCDLMERSDVDFDRDVREAVNDMVEYYDRDGRLRDPNVWAGSLAADKWFSLFKKINGE